MNDIHRSSVTNMQHHLLKDLEPLPFDDMLFADGFDNSSVVYSFDEFRRLYNDAVETMYHYRYLLSRQKQETEKYRFEAERFENLLAEKYDP